MSIGRKATIITGALMLFLAVAIFFSISYPVLGGILLVGASSLFCVWMVREAVKEYLEYNEMMMKEEEEK